MAALPPVELSLATLAALAELGPAPARAAAPVTLPGSGDVFSAARVTGENDAISTTYPEGVTHARVLPGQDEATAEWEERAAILEYEGGWPRTLAEAIATKLMSFNQRDSTVEERRALDRELLDLAAGMTGRGPMREGGQRVPPPRSGAHGVYTPGVFQRRSQNPDLTPLTPLTRGPDTPDTRTPTLSPALPRSGSLPRGSSGASRKPSDRTREAEQILTEHPEQPELRTEHPNMRGERGPGLGSAGGRHAR